MSRFSFLPAMKARPAATQTTSNATHGIGVSGFASTPYNVAVGGTDFGDTFAGTNSTYWNATNTRTYGSAKSYIPEIPWNDSCASVLIAEAEGYSQTYGSSGFCNSNGGDRSSLPPRQAAEDRAAARPDRHPYLA